MLAGPSAEDHGDAGLAGSVRGVWLAHRGRPYRPRLGACCRHAPDRTRREPAPPPPSPSRPAAPTHVPDAPLNPPITMASTYVAGRRPGVRPLHQPDLAGLRGGARRARGRPVPDLRRPGWPPSPPCSTWSAQGDTVVAPRHAYIGVDDAAGRPRGTRPRARGPRRRRPTPTRSIAACRGRRARLARVARPTRPSRSPTCRRSSPARTPPAPRVVVDNTFATPLLQRPLELGADLVVHSATKYLAGHSDVLMGAVRDPRRRRCTTRSRAAATSSAPIPGTLEAWLALRGLRTLHLRVERAQANAQELVRRLDGPPGLSRRSATPASAASSRSCWPAARDAGDLLTRGTSLWVHATVAGRRRVDLRAAAPVDRREPPTDPRGAGPAVASASRMSRTSGPTSPQALVRLAPSRIRSPRASVSRVSALVSRGR